MDMFIKIGGNQYPVVITDNIYDRDWDMRKTRSIRLKMTHAEAIKLFTDDASWSIVKFNEVGNPIQDEEGHTSYKVEVVEQEIYNNNDYCIAGSITDHRDGTITVKMGKPTAEELLAIFEEVL